VPTTATYGASDLLQIDSLEINHGTASSVASRALHKVAFLGDASGNRIYSGTDATYISRAVAKLDSGFDAYPLTDPMIVGDVNENHVMNSTDTTYVSQKAVRLNVPSIPDLPAGNMPVNPTAGLDPVVSVGQNLVVVAGQTCHVPVTIEGPAGVQAFDLEFTYDTTRLDLTSKDVTLAGLTASGWSLAVNVEDSQGVVFVSGVGRSPLPGGMGNILDLAFHAAEGTKSGKSPVGVVPMLGGGLNEGAMPITPIGGSVYVLDGATSRVLSAAQDSAARDRVLAGLQPETARDLGALLDWLNSEAAKTKKQNSDNPKSALDAVLANFGL
jgi:hypothetical protein